VRDLPPPVAAAVHEPYGARAVIYALLIDRDADSRKRQLEQLQHFGEDGIDLATLRLLPEIEALDRRVRLPLIDMALPALRALSRPQYRAFVHNVQALVAADQQMDLFEWTLQRLLLAHLRPHFERVKPPRIRYASLERLALECSVVLSTLAYVGQRSEATIRAAFRAGAAQIADAAPELLPPDRCGLRALDAAFERLAQVQMSSLQPLLAACAACITTDRTVTPEEGELMRAIADALGCPMPPLLPGQTLA
jgi:hypothetical protein